MTLTAEVELLQRGDPMYGIKRLESTVSFMCAYCGANNEIEVDPAEGKRVDLHEDCWVCCRPNLVHVFLDDETRALTAEAEEDL